MNNKQRILIAARRLMNSDGPQSVSTNQICEALGISPGNLYYHFKNKNEIVLALFDELESEFRAAFDVAPSNRTTPADFAGYYIRTLDVAFEYRFFFSDLLYLLRRDDELSGRYGELQAWTLDRLEQIAMTMAQEGQLVVLDESEGYRSIAINTWLIWSNWVRHVEITQGHNHVERSDMLRGIGQIFDVLSGNLKQTFAVAVRQELNRAQ